MQYLPRTHAFVLDATEARQLGHSYGPWLQVVELWLQP